jgi:hypothetical protein
MKKCIVKREYWADWGVWDDPVTDIAEIERLAAEWGKPVSELMEQVDELTDDEVDESCAEIEDGEPAIINLSNGLGRDYSISEVEDALADARRMWGNNAWDTIVNMMDDETREAVADEFAPCTEADFLQEYLRRAPHDLIIG